MSMSRRLDKHQKIPGRPAFIPEATIAEEFEPLFQARAEQLRKKPETEYQRQTRLAELFTNDMTPLFETQTAAAVQTTDDNTFTNDDLKTLLGE